MPTLITLAAAIALTINTHYYGVMLLVPLCAAEAFRTVQLRRMDYPVLASIVAGIAGIVFTLPFVRAAGEFHVHYYNLFSVRPRVIRLAYGAMLPDGIITYNHFIFLLIFVLVAPWIWIPRLRCGKVPHIGADEIFLVMLAALPLFGYLLARFVTHTIEVRFVLGAVIGTSALLSIILSPLFSRKCVANLFLAFLFVAVVVSGVLKIRREQKSARGTLSALTITPEIKAAIMGSPSQRVYFSNSQEFALASYYEPDPEVRSRTVLLYSKDQELHCNRTDTMSLSEQHMSNFAHFAIEPYESVAKQTGDHIFIGFPLTSERGDWDWIDCTLVATHPNVRHLQSAFGGDAMSVRFQP
jgi:hypothetical protein